MTHSPLSPRNAQRARSDVLAPSPRGERRGWQIGPRIRVGGTLGKIGQNVKIATGKALSNPIVDGALTFIPGVGPVLAGAAGAAGRVLDTSNGGLHGMDGVESLVKGAAEGYGAGKVAGVVKGVGSQILQHGVESTAGDWMGKLKDVISKGGDIKGMFDQVTGGGGGGGGAGGGGGGSLMDKGLLAAAIADAAATKQRQAQLQDKGLGYATDAYNEKAPLRQQGMGLLQHQDAPNLDFVNNPANPFSRSPAGMGTKVPITPQAGTTGGISSTGAPGAPGGITGTPGSLAAAAQANGTDASMEPRLARWRAALAAAPAQGGA